MALTLEDLFQDLAKMTHHERRNQRLWFNLSGVSHVPSGQLYEDTFLGSIQIEPKAAPANKRELCVGKNYLLHIQVPGGKK